MTHPWWLHYEGEQPTIDDLPTSSRAAEVRTALNMVDREREEREKLRAEVERLRGLLRRIEDVTTNEPDAVEAASRASYIAHDGLKRV